MKLTNYRDITGKDPRTEYEVELDNGQMIMVIRKHFPEWDESRGLWYASVPKNCKVSDRDVIAFVKSVAPKEHTMMPVFERKLKGAFAVVSDTCYSIEQAVWLAKHRWYEDANPDRWELFQIRGGKEVIKNYLK